LGSGAMDLPPPMLVQNGYRYTIKKESFPPVQRTLRFKNALQRVPGRECPDVSCGEIILTWHRQSGSAGSLVIEIGERAGGSIGEGKTGSEIKLKAKSTCAASQP
jgi:hypothetical protein